jgi:hypothetical protein
MGPFEVILMNSARIRNRGERRRRSSAENDISKIRFDKNTVCLQL